MFVNEYISELICLIDLTDYISVWIMSGFDYILLIMCLDYVWINTSCLDYVRINRYRESQI